MDIQRLEPLMAALRLANECESAAQMDVNDAKHRLKFAQKKLTAMECVLCDMQRAAQEAAEKVAGEIINQTDAPINAIREQEWR